MLLNRNVAGVITGGATGRLRSYSTHIVSSSSRTAAPMRRGLVDVRYLRSALCFNIAMCCAVFEGLPLSYYRRTFSENVSYKRKFFFTTNGNFSSPLTEIFLHHQRMKSVPLAHVLCELHVEENKTFDDALINFF